MRRKRLALHHLTLRLDSNVAVYGKVAIGSKDVFRNNVVVTPR